MHKTCIALLMLCAAAQGDTTSFIGALDPTNPNDVFLTTFTLNNPGPVTIQTYGYGGGVNAAGQTILPVGFDPVLGLYTGTGDSAVLFDYNDDGSCPPGTPKTFGSTANCFDSTLSYSSLAAGTYTISLTAFGNEPFGSQQPIFNTLGDGFLGLADYNDPADPSGATSVTNDFAFDLAVPSAAAPEPSAALYALLGLALVGGWRRERRAALVQFLQSPWSPNRRTSPEFCADGRTTATRRSRS